MAHLRDQDSIVLGDINPNIGQIQNSLSQQVADLLMDFGLMDLLRHFCQCLRFRHLKTWYRVRQGRLLQAHCDYILGMYQQLFQMVGIRDVINDLLDHFPLQSCLMKLPTRRHGSYLRGHRTFPLTIPTLDNFSSKDSKFP